MAVVIGDKLGVHEITSLLGKGGMGEVYRARDTRLKRDVAIKILPAEFARDPDRLLRFRREAEVLAALNHPNIGAIYDFQEADDRQFLVMELVEGETLADRLRRGLPAIEETLDIGAQICEALDAAHDKGIIHRDLKPANITIANDGRVKVLDFGLAKALEPARADGTMANSPTLSLTATQAGVILGTAAYMSPEQAKGFEVDRRSDIFSFGCVLYEMVTGRQAFQGETVPDVLASVLVRETDLGVIAPTLNPRLSELLQRCLQKNPKRRWQTASDVREEIEIIRKSPRTSALLNGAAAPRSLWRRALPLIVTGAVCAAIASAAAWALKPGQPAQVARFAIELPEGQNFTRTRSHLSAISRDGSMIVYVANRQLYMRRLDELEAHPIPGTDEDAASPFFSPDGRWIGFVSFVDTSIKKIPVNGGTAVALCSQCTSTLGHGVSWSGSTIVFSRGGQEIVKLPDTGTASTVWVKAAANELLITPYVLPGNRLMFSVIAPGGGIDDAEIVVLTENGQRKPIVRGRGARYVPTGHLVYSAGSDVYALPFNVDRLEPIGDPAPVVQGILRATVEYGAANFDVSETGTLIYASGSPAEGEGRRLVAIADRNGAIRAIPGLPAGAYGTPRVSPDGKHIALETLDDAAISIYDLSGRSQLRRLTLEGTNQLPVWSPDGTRVAFRGNQGGQSSLVVQRVDGTAPADRLTSVPAGQEAPMAWSTDDRIVFIRDNRMWMFRLNERRVEPMPPAPGESEKGRGTEFNVSLSGDNVWAAYVANEGRPPGFRVLLRQFPGGTKYPVSRELATAPVWSPDGRELFYYQTESRRLVSVRVQRPPSFSVTDPVALPIPLIQVEGGVRQYDVMPNGSFLILQPAPDERGTPARGTQQVHVVLNWVDELPRNAPPRR